MKNPIKQTVQILILLIATSHLALFGQTLKITINPETNPVILTGASSVEEIGLLKKAIGPNLYGIPVTIDADVAANREWLTLGWQYELARNAFRKLTSSNEPSHQAKLYIYGPSSENTKVQYQRQPPLNAECLYVAVFWLSEGKFSKGRLLQMPNPHNVASIRWDLDSTELRGFPVALCLGPRGFLKAAPLFESVPSQNIFLKLMLGDKNEAAAFSRSAAKQLGEPARTGFTLVHYAAQIGANEVLQQWIKDRPAAAKLSYKQQPTPLHLAAQYGRLEAASELLEAKADKNAVDEQDRSPLLEAASSGHAAIVKLLLDKRADPEIISRDLRTPFSEAFNNGHPEILDLLKHRVSDPFPDLERLKRLFRAQLSKSHAEMVAWMLKEHPKFRSDFVDAASLLLATRNCRADIIDLLINAGADPNWQEAGTPALSAAVVSNSLASVERLLVAGASPNIIDKRKKTPLHLAVENNSAKIISLLLAHGASLAAVDANGEAPLGLAIARDAEKSVDAIVNHLSRIDLPELKITQLVQYIVTKQRADLLQRMVVLGWPVDQPIHQNWTALELARALGASSCEGILLKAGAKGSGSPTQIMMPSDLTSPPVPVYQVTPHHPRPFERKDHTVVIELIVDAGGVPVAPRVKNSPDFVFNEYALKAISQWQFQPALKDQEPVATKTEVAIIFPASNKAVQNYAEPDIPARPAEELSMPRFPLGMDSSEKTGRVNLLLTIDKNGKVIRAFALETTSQSLVLPAIEGAKNWKFHPATAKGQNVESNTTIVVVFRN